MIMDIVPLILILAVSVAASCVQRVSGFGFGIIAMAVFPHLMPSYAEATALSGMLGGLNAIVPAIVMRRHVEWKKLLPIMITFLVVSFIAIRLVVIIGGSELKHMLGGVLIAVSLYFFFVSERIHVRPTIPLQVGMGSLSGMMGGLFAMQGPPAVIYFMASASDKESYIAMTQWYFFIGNLMMTVFRATEGIVTPVVLESFGFATLAVMLGTWIGSRIYDKMRIDILRKVVYAFLAVSGVVTLLS